MSSLERSEKVFEISKDRHTNEINPQEISESLGGSLTESVTGEFPFTVDLYYGQKSPKIRLKINPREKTILHAVPVGKEDSDGFFSSTKFYKVESLRFVEHVDENGNSQTDMLIYSRDSGTKELAELAIISSKGHTINS